MTIKNSIKKIFRNKHQFALAHTDNCELARKVNLDYAKNPENYPFVVKELDGGVQLIDREELTDALGIPGLVPGQLYMPVVKPEPLDEEGHYVVTRHVSGLPACIIRVIESSPGNITVEASIANSWPYDNYDVTSIMDIGHDEMAKITVSLKDQIFLDEVKYQFMDIEETEMLQHAIKGACQLREGGTVYGQMRWDPTNSAVRNDIEKVFGK